VRPIRSMIAFATFVIVASVTAVLLWAVYSLFSHGAIEVVLTEIVFGFSIYLTTTSIFGLIVFVPLLLASRKIALRRRALDAIIGALAGLIPTILLFFPTPAPQNLLGSDDALHSFALMVFVNAIAGATGGYAYWLTAGRPRRETQPHPTSS